MAALSLSNPLRTPREAAEMLGVTTQTLANWRVQKRGPNYCHMGSRVRYEHDELIAFVARQQVRRAA
ncbi:helix-turn-helix domain-containing protein [Burkholderia sp. JPY481]